MQTQENIARRGPVIWSNYELKLDQLDKLFNYITYAFQRLPETKRREFVRGLQVEAEAAIPGQVAKLRQFNIDDETTRDFEEKQRKKAKAEHRRRNHTQHAEWVNDGMVSAEILFRVTVFEDVMKHVHANMLKANPAILGLTNTNRTATFSEVFSPNFEKYQESQICREVKKVDRESMEFRLTYFAEHLKIDLTKERQWIIEISNMRNKIAHGSPLEAITKEDTTIPLPELPKQVAKTLREAMSATFQKGTQKHPQDFLRKLRP